MHPLNHILAATDLSVPARHAAERAALVSRETTARLDLLHVANLAPLERWRQFMDAAPPDTLEQRVLDAARQTLQGLAAALEQRFGVAAGTQVATGSLLAELVRHADELATGLLVCGAKGESVIRRLVLGTTALRVLGATTCPVLVVKQTPHEPYRTLLVPVDFSAASLRQIEHARRVAPRAEVVLLHAFDIPFEGKLRYASVDESTIRHYRDAAEQQALQRLRALRDEAGLPPRRTRLVVLPGDPSLRITEQEQEHDCDLIVMGRRGESVLEGLLVGSVTKHVLDESQGDVLMSV